MTDLKRFERAIASFDTYNGNDPNREKTEDNDIPKEFLYAIRMTSKLSHYAPDAPEHVQLAARCQHIGRWEIPRNAYPIDRKGYLQWRSQLAIHHATIAERILKECEYDQETIDKVKALLQKKQLHQNPDTQLLEDVICLVFVEYYLDDFANLHDDDKVIDILKKTLKKMSPKAIQEAVKISVSDHVKKLINKAASN
ncbi:MAG TPA: DUF4202 domain-containing protein [Cyclobacteriaceae bacterium]|nr:DUF4202 domain-containing protein [Cyclobacteriaceae bacterium]